MIATSGDHSIIHQLSVPEWSVTSSDDVTCAHGYRQYYRYLTRNSHPMVHCEVMCTTHICLHVMAIEGPLHHLPLKVRLTPTSLNDSRTFEIIIEYSRLFENIRDCSKLFENIRNCSRTFEIVREHSRDEV